jgi:hypothetical protein
MDNRMSYYILSNLILLSFIPIEFPWKNGKTIISLEICKIHLLTTQKDKRRYHKITYKIIMEKQNIHYKLKIF